MDKDVTGVASDNYVSSVQNSILTEVVSPLLGVATAIAFALFVYGGLKFIIARSNDDLEAIQKSKMHFIWGGVGLFIMVSIFSILKFVGSAIQSKVWFIN